MTETVDELGPVDWVVVEFPGLNYGNGKIAPVIKDYVDRGLVRVLDLLLLQKQPDGTLGVAELSDGGSDLEEFRDFETALAMVLSEQDVLDLAATIEPGRSAALLVWENLWAAPFGTAVRHAGGELIASGRIPTQAVVAAIEADAKEGA